MRVSSLLQAMVLAPLSGGVLSTLKPAAAGSAACTYGIIAQIGNAAGVAAIGAVFFAIALQSSRAGIVVSLALFMTLIMICAAFRRECAAPLHEVDALRLTRADFP